MIAFGAGHAGSNGRQHQNAFESFTEYENPDVEERDCWARVGTHRVGGTPRGDSLPDQYRDHEKRGRDDAGAQSGLHLPLDFITWAMPLLPFGCYFLAAICTRIFAFKGEHLHLCMVGI